jgi:hypothetical protein
MPENPYAISYGRHAAAAPSASNGARPVPAVPHPAAPYPAVPSSPITSEPLATDRLTAGRTAPGAPAQPAPAVVPGTTGPARRTPYSHGRRVFYGLVWAGWTALLTIAGFAALFGGQVLTGLLALAAAGVAAHYDYRIWTWRARRLLFLIIW